MTTSELMTIGAFARATGLTPGSLRFYADSSLLPPAWVDESTGYRYYAPEQVEQAVTIRRLREIDMPLDKVSRVLAGDTTHIDEHVNTLVDDAHRARQAAAHIRAALHIEKGTTMMTLNGPVFANAVEQILTATAHDPDHPVLAGVYLEAQDDILTLTATDRFRLSTRTMQVAQEFSSTWSALIDGDDLRSALTAVRQQHRVNLSIGPSGVDFQPADRHCRTLQEEFPDYRSMLNSLPAVSTRVVLSKTALQRSIENQENKYLTVAVGEDRVRVSAPGSTVHSDIEATITGAPVDLAFEVTTLYPAVASALGPDVMIDISGTDMPVVVRSADNGDLTTLAMPVDAKAFR